MNSKLVLAAAGVAVASGAFAAPLVYDYKATAKHMYLKGVDTNKQDADNDEIYVYMKVLRSAQLKGYLVMDIDGVTSMTVAGGACDPATTGSVSYDYGRNRGFLVVKNLTKRTDPVFGDDPENLRKPKIIPSVLDAKWVDQKYSAAKMPLTGLAEGVLFSGGDSIACVRSIMDGVPAYSKRGDVTDRAAAPQLPNAGVAGMTAYADYCWTSVYLFGRFNGINWYGADTDADGVIDVAPFDTFEDAWNKGQPAGLAIANWAKGHPYFHDTWMNGTGFGKYVKPVQIGKTAPILCCGLTEQDTPSNYDILLETLQGGLKGGIFLCTENGIRAAVSKYDNYDFFDGDTWRWENQFVTQRLVGTDENNGLFSPNDDYYQNDMWQDGAVEQETTDVMYGNWSIKLNTKWFTKAGVMKELTNTEIAAMFGLNDEDDIKAASSANFFDVRLYTLCCTLKSCMLRLDDEAVFCDGTEIHDLTRVEGARVEAGDRILPLVTPQFVKYYGLAN